MIKHSVFILAACLLAAPAMAQQPAGKAPTVVNRPLTDVPNAGAILSRSWVPGLDAGFVPQGLAVQGGQVVLAGYVSTDAGQSRGPCQLFWVNGRSGGISRRMSLPESCGHAGGVAVISGGRLVVADTRMLFVIAGGRVTSTVKLSGGLRGSFADFDGRDLWIGGHDSGTLWRIPLAALSKPEISPSDATQTLSAPSGGQGLAFDRRGQMWLTTSNSRGGMIYRLDAGSGQVLASYAAPAGIEDIAFDGSGRLWASSEAGSRRWANWSTFFPLVFSIDVSKLR